MLLATERYMAKSLSPERRKTPPSPQRHKPVHGGAGSGSGKHPTPTGPAFGQPRPGPDPGSFKVPHPSDDDLYKLVNAKLVQPFPPPRGGSEPILTLAEVWGPTGPAKAAAITQAGSPPCRRR